MGVTEKCDVYSFGVVALEIIMGRHPGDLLSTLTSPSTENPTVNDVLDPRLSRPMDRLVEWDIVMVMRLAFSYLSSNPKSRPSMQSASQEFLVHRMPLPKPLHWNSLSEESEALAGIRWWWNVHPSMNHCDWYGIKCNEAGSVTYISCPRHPHFDGEVGMDELNLPSFQNLETLYLDYCGLKGTIPYEIELGNLKNLEYLYLGSNAFSGPIPSSICVLTNLTTLDLSGNQLTGFIPAKLWNLKNLEFLSLSNNYFSGTIPSSVYALTKLTVLELDGNRLSGFIPSKIQNLNNLISLRLEWNNLSGTIPPTMGLLTNLTHLDLSHNLFDGIIPDNLSYLSKLKFLNLSYNKLVGLIPTILSKLCSSS
ncbi:hypothetical protein LguiB_012786 [Lonicera macranthoides]